ncbi:MAG: hypothetical protein MGG11_13295, partial [Trichodesmium sp. MAG_R03]|nr:hypothetical protein [Trichodesmium sp. MAG_R03]
PISNPIPQQLFNSIKAQFAGFYPDIVFYYDPLDVTANLYAFEAYGQKIVQMSGGLARLQGFNYEGLFMAMAHGIARFYGGEPKNTWGYSAVGQADSYAFGVISRFCWISSPFMTYATTAMNQWEAVFQLVDSTNAGGNPQDPLNDPSLQCRFENIQTAVAGGGLLECAGGEPLPTIRLDEAQATSTTKVMLTFSLALDPDTATDVSNYLLSPEAPVTSAELDEKTNFIVHLEVELEAGAHYEITVRNLTSILGSGLDPDHVSVAFDTP